jgi:hypothetical protein
MATYKVWLTVKDSYGNVKDIDGGTINVDLAELTATEAAQIKEVLPLDDYLKKEDIPAELDSYATDLEVGEAVKQTVKYSGFRYKSEPEKVGE